ncbi:hypothetical protein E2C01_049171 [Portunus trituberculatus]|uniref:Uncharacterized protein n=1 Tax=Portunus trituberculatus TaxID=210409 RepID=A0A5B7G4X9_PORTR|nr:hypothetical protein [Portunus trituberculatus]
MSALAGNLHLDTIKMNPSKAKLIFRNAFPSHYVSFSKATETTSRVIKTISPFDNLEILPLGSPEP